MSDPKGNEGANQQSPREQTGEKQPHESGSEREKLKSLLLEFRAWLLAKDEGQEMSFLAKAISSGSTFFRAIVILLAAFFLLKNLALEIIERFVVQVDEITFSAEGNPVIKIKGEKQELRVVSVPAQRWISSGVLLDQNTKIEIRATGLVATGLAVPRYLEEVLYNQFKDEQLSSAYSELGWRLSKLEFNQDVYLGWREADGKLVQEYGPDPADTVYGSECVAKKSKEKLIAPNFDYGVLLAFVADKDLDSADKVFKSEDRDKFFLIGKSADIELRGGTNSYYVTTYLEGGKGKPRPLPAANWKEPTLYFTINDTVIRNKKDLTIFTECEKQENKPVPKHLQKYHRNREERYQKMYSRLSENPETLWFMDNKGDFTVTIITTK